MTLALTHSNAVAVDHDVLRVDRKFHEGMLIYAEKLRVPMLTIHPELPEGGAVMDAIEIRCSELPYQVMTVKVDRMMRPLPSEAARLRERIAGSDLVYGGSLGSPRLARDAGVPYALVLEYDLQTQISVAVNQVNSPMRRVIRAARCAWRYATWQLDDIRHAHSLHCNGYPIYESARRHNPNCLLYFDSRMSADAIISPDRLKARLSTRAGRPLRLLFSGRYERIKGVEDATLAAVECLRRGLNIEMHFYGQGALRSRLEQIASQSPRAGQIQIHDAIPYPELAALAQSFDLFICCHIQNDPSCTYLESFGAGLPIVGYANRMWRHLQKASGAGYASPLGRPERVADDVQRLVSDHATLSRLSERAVEFVREHTFEREFDKRITAMEAALSQRTT
jgi:colanic acid/amylovoran biosynthesis glycosyltransferase